MGGKSGLGKERKRQGMERILSGNSKEKFKVEAE